MKSADADNYKWNSILEMLDGFSPGISLGNKRIGDYNDVFQLTNDRFRHSYICGGSGSGKTTGLVWMAHQDIVDGTQIVFFDPHGDAIKRLLPTLPQERLENIVYIDFSRPDEYLSRMNLFDIDIKDKALVDRACEDAIEVLRGPVSFSWSGARFEEQVRASVMTVLDEGFCFDRSILQVSRLILDESFKKSVLKDIKSGYVKRAWSTDAWAARSNDYGEVKQWIVSKFDIYDTNEKLRRIFGPGKSTFNLEQLIADGKTILITLPESTLGTKVADILVRTMTLMLKRAIMSRGQIPSDNLRPCVVYLDEFQRFAENRAFSELLSECRKMKVALVLANQNLRQLTPFNRATESINSELLESVLANTGTLIAYKPSANDADILAKQFEITPEELRKIPRYSATVRLLSDGQEMKPVVVSVPLITNNLNKNAELYLSDRMIDEGFWLTPESFLSDIADIEDRPQGENVRASCPLPNPSGLSDKNQGTSTRFIKDDKSSTSAFLDDWLAKRRDSATSNVPKPTVAKKQEETYLWEHLSQYLGDLELKTARQELLGILDAISDAKQAEENFTKTQKKSKCSMQPKKKRGRDV